MPIETVRAEWIRDQVFMLQDRAGFPIIMTQPNGVNGADLLPLSLIGCAGWDVVSILRKQRQDVNGFEVTAESERDDDPPWRFRAIRITYHLCGRNLDEAHVQRAIQLTEEKYCSIFATLRDAVRLESAYRITQQ